MFERIENGEFAVGSLTLTTSPEWVEILSHAGLDAVCFDMMITSIDWREAADMVRAANRYNVTPWVRLPSFPWGRTTPYIPTADVVRALSIGAECVTVSLDTPEEVEATIAPADDHHRRIYIQGKEYDDWLGGRADVAEHTLIAPLLESLGAVNKLDEIFAIKDLKAVWLGMGDLCTLLGHPGNPEHPEMRAFIKKVVDLGKNNGVMVFVNTGRKDTEQPMVEQAAWLWEIGVKFVWLTYPSYIAQRFYERSLDMLSEKVTRPIEVGSAAGVGNS
jgi:2-keto-3-deoxy-L-rhamnonate aldolase RhmA